MARKNQTLKLNGVYLARIGRREGQDIWIVDGNKVARDIYPEFVFGGNDMRYCFNPPDEVWIDSRVGVEELETTILHELVERRLMKDEGLTYGQAHDKALELEVPLRPKWERQCLNAGKMLLQHANEQKVEALLKLPEAKLLNLYRQPVGRYRGASIWIVDGTIVRKELNPDFGLADSLHMSNIVPANQLWLDSSMCTLEAYFALKKRKRLHILSQSGINPDQCYDLALAAEGLERKKQARLCARHEARLEPVSYGARNRFIKD
ncbi:MAG: hypothetical protein K2Z81_05765 [Cyanobacteria bacterium]|nr:hypothetical protein [Cyanobacteriota bacterium]